MNRTRGFTLVEVIVTVSVIAILASMLIYGMLDAGRQSRDAERQANLRLVQNALDLYKNKYGRYPEGCNGANRWSAQTVTAGVSLNRCSDGSLDYIRDLAPEFIPTLPIEIKPNGDNSGYMYYVNTDGTAFKLISAYTVEAETVTENSKFKGCDVNPGVCDAAYNPPATRNGTPVGCRTGDLVFQTSYAVWGGYPYEPFTTAARREQYQEDVVCKMP